MTQKSRMALTAGIVVLCGAGLALAQTWSNAALLNEAGEAGNDVKTGKIFAAKGGGFHSIYNANSRVRYRRFTSGGSLLAPVTVFNGAYFAANATLAESLNGEVHVAFEDWLGSPEVRWYKSSDGGASFAVNALLTNTGGCAKHPQLAPFGTGNAADLVMSYYRSSGTGGCDKSIYFRRYNGSTWTADADIGSSSDSEYDCFGMARSPLDGSVWRTFDPSHSTMNIRQYNGSWGGEAALLSGAWAVRQHVAVNASGQVMIMYDDTSRIRSILYTPGSGVGSVIDVCEGGYSGSCDVCAIPGSSDFYMVVARPVGGNFHVYGRKWTGGAWGAEESVQNGQADDFIVTPVVTADTTGKLYCIWEYWASGKPQQWYAYKNNTISGPTGTIAGTVWDNLGAALPNVSITVAGVGSAVTAANGAYSIIVPTGSRTVEAYKTFYTPGSATVTVSQNLITTQNFTLSTSAPAQIASLALTASNRANTLNWTCPSSSNFNRTMLRYSTTASPNTISEGTLLAEIAGTPSSAASYTHSSLTNGMTYYYSVFAYFQDASRYYATGAPAKASGAPFGPGDYDHDGDVDQGDFGYFQICYSGAFIAQNDPACQDRKFDSDSDVDFDDLALWQDCYSGPGIAANPNCH